MAVVAEEIYSLLIPLEPDRLIVPRACVAAVVRYNPKPVENPGVEWLCGMADWNNREIPVISFESLCGGSSPQTSGRTRVVVFHSIGDGDCPAYGVLSEGFPQMVKVSREVIDLDASLTAPPNAPLICRVSLLREQAVIPDLEAVEQQLLEVLPG